MSRSACACAALVLALAGFAAPQVTAQEVRWRHDYSAARREAVQTGRPLLLDFGTEACVWCKKQDATTFRAKAVADSLNAKFIPVKIDAERAMNLVQALGIQGYPEVIVAAPDGTILGRHPGYADVSQMMGLLEGSLKRMPKPVAAAAPPQTVVPAAAVAPAPAVTPTPAALTAKPPAGNWDAAHDEIARKLTQVYLERGAELCRRGRPAEGEQYLGVAATLSPDSPSAGAARDMLDKLKRGEGAPRP